MKFRRWIAAAVAVLGAAASAHNIVPEGKRDFEVPFKGAGRMSMVYTPVFFPKETEGVVVSGEAKWSDVVRGDKNWFDARIMTDFIDSNCKKVKGGPAIGGWHGKGGEWKAFRKSIKVPEGAAGISVMPCLFRVKSGALEIRNLSVEPQETWVEDPEDKAKREAHEKRKTENAVKTRAKAKYQLDKYGTLIPAKKDGQLYAHLVQTTPGKMVNDYKEYGLPEGVDALKLSWKWNVANLKTGEKPWFDARVLLKFKDAEGKEVKPEPRPTYVQKPTNGWQDRENSFLVPQSAVKLVVMFSLFQVKSGEMDVSDVKLVPTDPQPLIAAKEKEQRQIAARQVPDEKPDKAKWPSELRVVGNRLRDAAGREVWLQGVNAGGMESIPNTDQIVKSVVVAIDEWKSNCVRLPVNEMFWFGTSPYQSDGGVAYRAAVDKIVTLAANRGAYIALDLHRFRAPKAEHVTFWKDAAKRYANHPAVIFDLFNEPHEISWKVWRDGGWVGQAGKVDESAFLTAEEKKKNQGFESVGMQALVDAVRSTGAKNIVIAGGLHWANDLTGIESEAIEKGEKESFRLSDPNGNGIMYAWHTYHWHKGWAHILPVAAKHPIFLGEVGAAPREEMTFIPLEQKEDPYTFSPDMLGFIQKHRINWTGWCFHPKAGPCMIENWDYEPTPYWGEFALRALKGEKFELNKIR